MKNFLLSSVFLAVSLLTIETPASASMSSQTEEMMAAMQKAMTPGKFHKKMAPMAGTFTAVSKMWMEPGQEPIEGKGISKQKWVLGERFIEQQFEGKFMGRTFHGIGYVGYDNTRKKYFNTWIDSMGTGVMIGEGALRPDGAIEFHAEYPDPMSGEMAKFREVYHIEDDDHHRLEMFTAGPDGKEFLHMEIRYVRKK